MDEQKKKQAKCPMCGEILESVYMTVQCESCGWFANAEKFAEMVEDGEIELV